MRAHRATIWKKQLTTKYRVMDLHGRAIPPDDLAAAGAGAGGAAAAAFDNNLYYHQHAQPLAHPDQHVVSIDYHPLGAAGGAGGSGSVNNGGAGVGIVPSAPLPPSYDDSMVQPLLRFCVSVSGRCLWFVDSGKLAHYITTTTYVYTRHQHPPTCHFLRSLSALVPFGCAQGSHSNAKTGSDSYMT